MRSVVDIERAVQGPDEQRLDRLWFTSSPRFSKASKTPMGSQSSTNRNLVSGAKGFIFVIKCLAV